MRCTSSVISDGSGMKNDNEVQVAFELKFPMTGKERVPDVFYEIPIFYIYSYNPGHVQNVC